MTQPYKRKRLNLDLTPEAIELLKKLALEGGNNLQEVINKGLELYGVSLTSEEAEEILDEENDE